MVDIGVGGLFLGEDADTKEFSAWWLRWCEGKRKGSGSATESSWRLVVSLSVSGACFVFYVFCNTKQNKQTKPKIKQKIKQKMKQTNRTQDQTEDETGDETGDETKDETGKVKKKT